MSISRTLEPFDQRHLGEATLALQFENFRVQVKSDREEILEGLKAYYGPFVVDTGGAFDALVVAHEHPCFVPELPLQEKAPEPGKKKIKEHFHEDKDGLWVHKVLTGVNLVYLEDRSIAIGPLLNNLNQLVNFINNIFMDHQLLNSSALLFHAAALCVGGQGLGMAGPSGRGKSTLCLHLLERGGDFVSNDRLMVEANQGELSMMGVPKYPRINPGTIVHQKALSTIITPEDRQRYESLSPSELWELEEKYDAMVDRLFDGCSFRLAAPMKRFIILDWTRSSEEKTTLEKVNSRDLSALMPHIMKRPGILAPRSRQRLGNLDEEAYYQLFDRCEVYALRGKIDFSQAIDLIEALP